MAKSALALILVLLQGITALPARLNLCFERGGAFCCVDSGEHECRCEHSPKPCANDSRHVCCGHSHEQESPKSDEQDLSPSKVNGENSGHQHITLISSQHETTRCEPKSPVNDSPLPIDYVAAVSTNSSIQPFAELSSYGDLPAQFLSFSLFARASTVLRC